MIHHKREEKRKIKFSKFGPAGLEPTHVPDKGLHTLLKRLDFKGLYLAISSVFDGLYQYFFC